MRSTYGLIVSIFQFVILFTAPFGTFCSDFRTLYYRYTIIRRITRSFMIERFHTFDTKAVGQPMPYRRT